MHDRCVSIRITDKRLSGVAGLRYTKLYGKSQMKVGFNTEQWQRIKNNSAKWWAGELGRPLLHAELKGLTPAIMKPEQPFYGFVPFYDFSLPAEKIVDVWNYELASTKLIGDAFPNIFPNFGPGSIAAYMGADVESGNETVWFKPTSVLPIEDITFEYLPDNKWYLRTKKLVEAAMDRWQGAVQIAMTDLGGNLDILSAFRPAEKLVFDLFDAPQEVKRLTWQAHEMWWRYFEEFNSITSPTCPGFSCWNRMFSDIPSYVLQCDFCFMISPDMFDEFVKPELAQSAEQLSNVVYHLDGPGQLTHLDSLLEIDAIDCIQWIPGAGSKTVEYWPEVYKKITQAGKRIQVFSSQAENPHTILDTFSGQLGGVDHISFHFDGNIAEQDEVEKLFEKYGCIC